MAHPLQSFFSKIRIFARLDADELNDILRAVQPMTLPPGRCLFAKGDQGDAAYIIDHGTIEVFTEQDGQEITIAKLTRGDVLGELSLLDGSPRSASARAVDQVSLFRLDKSEFDFLRRNLQSSAYKLIREISTTLCDRIRDTNEHIGTLLTTNAIAPTSSADTDREATPAPRPGWLARIFSRSGT